MAAMMFVILWLGLYPQPFLNTARGSLDRLLETGRTELTAGLSPSIDPGGVHDSH